MKRRNRNLGIIVLTTIIGFSFITCDLLQDKENENNGNKIGSTGPGGGIIFYHNPNGFTVEMMDPTENYTAYYLEAATVDVSTSTIKWCNCANANVGCMYYGLQGTEQGIGKGRKNTALIASSEYHIGDNSSNNSAIACIEYGGGGKDDWFLPSRDELQQILEQCKHIPNRGSISNYWSSNQAGNNNAYYQLIGTAAISSVQGNTFKFTSYYVRAIRAY